MANNKQRRDISVVVLQKTPQNRRVEKQEDALGSTKRLKKRHNA